MPPRLFVTEKIISYAADSSYSDLLMSWYLILRPRGWTRYMNSEALTIIMRLQHQRHIKPRFQKKRPRLVKNMCLVHAFESYGNKRPHNGASNQHG